MRFGDIKAEIEVFYDNRMKVGVIKWDAVWECWRISFNPDARLSKEHLKEIYRFIRRLGNGRID